MVSAGMQLVKYLLFIFNFVFWVTGIAILSIGVWAKVSYSHYLQFAGTAFPSLPILLIIVGCVIIVIAFFGCCGAIRENHCMIITFSVLLGIIFVLQIAAGIAAYVLRGQLKDLVKDEMEKGIKDYEDNPSFKKLWDSIQHDAECCGLDGSNDWHKWNGKNFNNGETPDSCCTNDTNNCGKDGSAKYQIGCYDKVQDVLRSAAYIIGGVCIGIAFVQIVGIIFACCLGSAIKREYQVV